MTDTPDGKRDFFVSFNQADRPWATWIAWVLEEKGYSVFFQDWDFRPGHNFVLAMHRAATLAERTVPVLSPNFLASPFTKPEWASAFADDPTGEQGRIIPVRVAECNPEGLLGPIIYIDLVGRDEAKAKDELLRGVRRGRLKPPVSPVFPGATAPVDQLTVAVPKPARFPGALPAELHNVPELPPHFLPRPDAVDGLKRKLLGPAGGAVAITGVATRIGVQGMGGIGKSVLTAAVVRNDEVRSAFPAGIFWVSLGQMPDVLIRQADLYWLLTREKGDFADAQQGRIALQEALRGHRCLVVLDDVWRLADAEAFNVVDADARLLLTTRDAAIVKSIGACEHEVDRLDRPASRRLLAKAAGIAEETLPAEAQVIAEACGDLPLALALAGGMIEGRADMWSLVLEALRMADWEQINRDFAGYPYRHVFAAIEASVNALGADRERYLDLAIFPDVPFPEAALKTLWADLKPLQVRRLVTRFRDRSLARLDVENRLTLHDLQRDFVRKRASDLPARRERLVEAYRSQCPNGWASGPDDGYFFQFLPTHLAATGRSEELTSLLADYDWLAAKLKVTDLQSVLADYQCTPDEPHLGLIERALRLSAGALTRDSHHLPSQLIGRLRGFENRRVQALLEQAEKAGAGPGAAWLCPHTASLFPPGSLVQTFTGHTDGVRALAVLSDGRVVSRSRDGTLRVWEVDSGASRVLESDLGWEGVLAVLPDGHVVSDCSGDGALQVWEVDSGASRVLKGHTSTVDALAVLPDGRLVSGFYDGALQVWEVDSGAGRVLKGHTNEVTALAVLPDGRLVSGSDSGTRYDGYVVSGSFNNILRVWDVASGASRVLTGHTDGVRALVVLPDGRVVSGSDDHTLRVWEVASGASRALEGHTSTVTALAVLPDGRGVSGSKDHTLRV